MSDRSPQLSDGEELARVLAAASSNMPRTLNSVNRSSQNIASLHPFPATVVGAPRGTIQERQQFQISINHPAVAPVNPPNRTGANEGSVVAPAPPPYTPHPGAREALSNIPGAQLGQTAMSGPSRLNSTAMLASRFEPFMGTPPVDGTYEDDSDERSPISIRISCPMNIRSDSNIIEMPSNPTVNPIMRGERLPQPPAQRCTWVGDIAHEVLCAIKESTAAHCGLPMIDENGCPRPMSIEVEAGLTVHGRGNIVGSRRMIESLCEKGILDRSSRIRKRPTAGGGGGTREGEVAGQGEGDEKEGEGEEKNVARPNLSDRAEIAIPVEEGSGDVSSPAQARRIKRVKVTAGHGE